MSDIGRREIILGGALAGAATLGLAGQEAGAQTRRTRKAAVEATGPLRSITPQNSVLVMVDYMDKLLDSVKSHSRNLMVNNATALANIGRIFELPTFVLGDESERLGNFDARIHAPIPTATKVPRHTVSAWREPAFVNEVEATGRRNLIVAGISTDMCVALLSLDALRAEYDVTLVVDASGSQSLEMHQTGAQRLVEAGCIPVTWVSLAAELMGDWESPYGRDLGQLYTTFLGMN